MTDNKTLDLSSLQRWAEENLPSDSALRAVLSVEKTQIPTEDFSKFETWLRLSHLETATNAARAHRKKK